jgi:hypothetical protein
VYVSDVTESFRCPTNCPICAHVLPWSWRRLILRWRRSCGEKGGIPAARQASLLATQERFEEVATLAAESAWIRTFRAQGMNDPWRAGQRAQLTPNAFQELRKTIAVFEDDLARLAEERAQIERGREFEERNLPPGTLVWRGGFVGRPMRSVWFPDFRTQYARDVFFAASVPAGV